jgi:hypothetical protein
MRYYHKIEQVSVNQKSLNLSIDGKKKHFNISVISEKLRTASDLQRNTFEISPSGYGISWPLIDEDLSIDGLLKINHSPRAVTRREHILHR